ncbi:hypothetical protein M231_01364, partial [Tremella mesenterica]
VRRGEETTIVTRTSRGSRKRARYPKGKAFDPENADAYREELARDQEAKRIKLQQKRAEKGKEKEKEKEKEKGKGRGEENGPGSLEISTGVSGGTGESSARPFRPPLRC